MGLIFDVYKLKLKVFFGSLKASKLSVILLLSYSLAMIPAIVGILILSIDLIKESTDLMFYTNTLSAILSTFLALNLILTYRGTTAFEYEQDFIFTSHIKPRKYLIASLLAEGTASLLFLFPLPIFLAITVFSLNLSVTATLSIFVSSFLLFLFASLVRSSFSIFGAIYKTSMKTLTTILIIILLFPAASIFIAVPINYVVLPYPTTFTAQILLSSLANATSSPTSVFGFSLYVLASLVCFFIASKRNFFQFTYTVPLISAFDMSMRMQTMKADTNIRFFSKVGLKIALTSESKSLLTFLMKKEFIRMLRDGSLFVTLLLYIITSIMAVAVSSRGIPVPIWLFLLVIYSFIIPPMLVGNWRVIEMKSLWIPLTSGLNLSYLARSMLYDFTIIASTVPVAIIIVLTFISGIAPLIPLVLVISVSMIGCSANLYMVMHFLSRGKRATPSIMISWVSILLSALLLSPIYVFIVFTILWNFSLAVNATLSVFSLAYSMLIFRFFSKAIGRKALSIEL
ncbi:hypothetical protein KAS14_02685 [Candidatus Bathyarchaeota archaeon]|nr:hypothetical protein [Candidatus Bathyarchaeota archaeon]